MNVRVHSKKNNKIVPYNTSTDVVSVRETGTAGEFEVMISDKLQQNSGIDTDLSPVYVVLGPYTAEEAAKVIASLASNEYTQGVEGYDFSIEVV